MADTDGTYPENWDIPTSLLSEFKEKRSDYCVCIPVLNEEGRIGRQLQQMYECRISESADILILDGGSTDNSVQEPLLKGLGVRALLTKTGQGKLGAQLRMGFAYACIQGYRGIVTVDGNNKDGVEAIPRFIEELQKGFDFIQGSRYLPGGEAVNTPWARTIAIKAIHAPTIGYLAGFTYTDTTNGFRGYSRRFILDPRVSVFRDIFDTYELLAYLSVQAARLGFRVKEIPVRRVYPAHGAVPTKISSIRGNYRLIKILFDLWTQKFEVRGKTGCDT